MSLIVARIVGGSLFAIADTKITNPAAPQNPYTDGVAKLFLLDETRFVGFSGEFLDVRHVLDGLDATKTDNQVLATMVQRSAQGKLDYLFGRLGPPPSIVKVTEGRLLPNETWIGDHDAFRLYQGYFLEALVDPRSAGEFLQFQIQKVPELATAVPDPGSTDYFAMFGAFKKAIDSGRADSVGGFVLPIVTDKGQLRYPLYFDTWYGMLEMPAPGEAISMGTAEQGAFSVNFGQLGTHAFIVFLDEAQLGLLFETGHESLSRCVPQMLLGDEIDVNRVLKPRFGVGIPFGRRSSPTHYYVKAVHLVRAGDLGTALELLHEGVNAHLLQWAKVVRLPSPTLLGELGLPEEHQNLARALKLRGQLRMHSGQIEQGSADLSASAAVYEFAAKPPPLSRPLSGSG